MNYSAQERRQLAKDGKALPDGSFPIKTRADLQNAINDVGRASSNARAKAFIIKRAKAEGWTDALPPDWEGSTQKTAGEWSFDDAEDALSVALNPPVDARYVGPPVDRWRIVAVYPDHFIYAPDDAQPWEDDDESDNDLDDGPYYQADYTLNDDGTVTIGDPTEVAPQTSWLPVGAPAQASQPTSSQVHVPGTGGGETKPSRLHYLSHLTKSLKSMVDKDAYSQAVKRARAHAGGKTRGTKPKPDMSGMGDMPMMQASAEYVPGWRLFSALPDGEAPDWIPCLPKPGKYLHPRWGVVAITSERNQRFIESFKNQTYQEHIPIDAEHQTKLSGALGYYRELRQNADGSVDARVEWTDRGKQLLSEGRFKYFSPEWFDEWTDPATGTSHKDVLSGGAITTRPFFKDGALRSLVASEGGLFAYAEGEPVDGASQLTAFDPIDAADAAKEEPVAEQPTNQTPASVPVGMTEEQAKTFAEMQAELALLRQASEAKDAAIKQAAERVASLEAESRRKRFSDMVLGRGGEGDGAPWFGDAAKHVAFMEKLALQFGETSDELGHYIEQQRASAAQMQASGLFREVGSDHAGAAGGALAEVNAKAQTLVAEGKAKTFAEAMVAVAESDKELYARYRAEQGR